MGRKKIKKIDPNRISDYEKCSVWNEKSQRMKSQKPLTHKAHGISPPTFSLFSLGLRAFALAAPSA